MKRFIDMNKKTLILAASLLFVTISLSAQSKKKIVQDTIFRLGGRQIICFVQKVNQFEVDYKFLNDPTQYSIEIKQIEKIIYRTGRIEPFNKPVFIEVDENSWEAVLITEKREDVKGMYKYGEVEAPSSPGAKNKSKAIYTAKMKLQKKAAGMKGNIVLITKTEPRGGYGEPPSYVLKGDVYGYQPMPEEEVDDRKEVLDDILK